MAKIIVNAGGTGGHLFPAIAAYEELTARGHELHLITDLRCQKYLPQSSEFSAYIVDCRISRAGIKAKLTSAVSILSAIAKALLLLRRLKPEVVVGFGGYPTFPVLLASIILRIPIVVHEQNCFLGKVNRFFAKFATKVALSYPETFNLEGIKTDKLVVTGDVVREKIKQLPQKKVLEGRKDKQELCIFIFGGSQAAKIFSSLVPESFVLLLKMEPQIKLKIIQQAPPLDHAALAKIYDALNMPYELAEFFYNIAEQYSQADLVIARAGASTIAELTHIGLPAIFVPLPSAADNHQFYNAIALQQDKASWCYEQKDLTPEILAAKILELYKNKSLLDEAAARLVKRQTNGNKILADTVEKIIH